MCHRGFENVVVVWARSGGEFYGEHFVSVSVRDEKPSSSETDLPSTVRQLDCGMDLLNRCVLSQERAHSASCCSVARSAKKRGLLPIE